MAKQNMIDTAKELETQAQSLFERIKKTQDALGETLNAIRGAEGRLTEKEQQAAKERAERERAERLRELLEREDDLAFHVGAPDEADEADLPAPPAKQPEAPASAPVQEAAPVRHDAPQVVVVPTAPAQEEPEPTPAPAPQAKAVEAAPSEPSSSKARLWKQQPSRRLNRPPSGKPPRPSLGPRNPMATRPGLCSRSQSGPGPSSRPTISSGPASRRPGPRPSNRTGAAGMQADISSGPAPTGMPLGQPPGRPCRRLPCPSGIMTIPGPIRTTPTTAAGKRTGG